MAAIRYNSCEIKNFTFLISHTTKAADRISIPDVVSCCGQAAAIRQQHFKAAVLFSGIEEKQTSLEGKAQSTQVKEQARAIAGKSMK